MPDSNGLILTSINKSRIKGLAVFKNTLYQDTLNNYLDQDGCINFKQLKSDLFSKSIQERPKLEVIKEPSSFAKLSPPRLQPKTPPVCLKPIDIFLCRTP